MNGRFLADPNRLARVYALVFALLVRHGARRFASRLAGRLAFATRLHINFYGFRIRYGDYMLQDFFSFKWAFYFSLYAGLFFSLVSLFTL